MIKLRSDARTPSLTYEQFTSLQDALYLFLGGDALSYMGKLSCDVLLQALANGHNHDAIYAALSHAHDEVYAALTHDHDEAYAALTHNHDTSYAVLTHNHDEAYAALSHNHDSDYADIDHNHDTVYARLATVSWSGNTSAATNRDINYTPAITPKIILMLGWSTSSDVLGFIGVWENMSTSLFHVRPNSNYLYAGIATNIFYEAPSAGKLPLYSQSYNLTGYNYRGLIWGGLS